MRSGKGKVMTEIELKLMSSFPKSFINFHGEFIAHDKANEYFILKNCADDLEIKCKVLEWLSRGASKTEPYKARKKNEEFNNFMLKGINDFLGTNFNRGEMLRIYEKLGNSCDRNKTIRFIQSGYRLEVLESVNMSGGDSLEKA